MTDDRSELGLRIEAGLREAIAYRKGEVALRTRLAETMPAERVKAIRKAVAKSPREFEAKYGVPARTLEGWEQGRKVDAPARVLLTLIERDAEAVLRLLAKAPGS
jgi:putative transcriptional regulator